MAFVLELEMRSSQQHIKNYIISLIRQFRIKAKVTQQDNAIVVVFASDQERLPVCLDAIAQHLPASLFLKNSRSYLSEEHVDSLPEIIDRYPLNLGLCPLCQKEMLDVSSRRYYYPFTSCSCCGGNYSFLKAYPYERERTSFKFFSPCDSCNEEMHCVGLKENHPINSCHHCGVPVRLYNHISERYANDAGSFRTMFEVVAKALKDGKKVLMKTTLGYRLFYAYSMIHVSSTLMMLNASKITDHLSLITEEFYALLSIERPILHVTLKNEELKQQSNANTMYVKYPDDGFSILLGVELQKLGVDYIGYEEADADVEADLYMDYDLDITPQSDLRVFLNKEILFIAEGERVSFPSVALKSRNVLSIAHKYIGMPYGQEMFFDQMEHFESVTVEKAQVLEGVAGIFHSRQNTVLQDEASFMSVIAEHHAFGRKCVGAYFENEPSFLYYDGKRTLRIIPPKPFEASTILEEIANLREGSDRLVHNIEKRMPQVYEKLKRVEHKKQVKLFEMVALLLELDDISMRGVTKEAMKFIGKGGIQIDMRIADNRFDNVAFLSSIISYQLAGVSSTILAYSIFESLGDYFCEILQELKAKTQAVDIVLCGTHFANQSLFSRMQRNLKMNPPLINLSYPIGGENAVVGGLYL